MQQHLPCCSTPVPFNSTFSPSFPARFLGHPQMHTQPNKHSLSLSEAGNPFSTDLPRCERGKLHLAWSRSSSPPSLPALPTVPAGALHRVAPAEESIAHCRVTLLLWMAGKTSGRLLTLLEAWWVGVRSQHRRTLAPLHSYLHSSPLLNLVHA